MRILTLAAVAMLAISGVAQAGFNIDDFDKPDTDGTADGTQVPSSIEVVSASLGGPTSASNTDIGLPDVNVVGGTREASLLLIESFDSDTTKTRFGLDPDNLGLTRMRLSNNDDAVAVLTLNYDSGGAGLNKDFTADGSKSIIIDILSIDVAGMFSFTVVDGSAASDTVIVTRAGGATGVLAVDFTEFAGIDFTDVFSVTIEIVGAPGVFPSPNGPVADETGAIIGSTFSHTPGLDVTIDAIHVGVVPEPASMALMGLGSLLVGCGVARRRRKQASELVS